MKQVVSPTLGSSGALTVTALCKHVAPGFREHRLCPLQLLCWVQPVRRAAKAPQPWPRVFPILAHSWASPKHTACQIFAEHLASARPDLGLQRVPARPAQLPVAEPLAMPNSEVVLQCRQMFTWDWYQAYRAH